VSRLTPEKNQPPLIAHVINELAIGGMENGLVNLINRMPEDRYRHAIICLKRMTDFRERIHKDIPIVVLGKRDGKDLSAHSRFVTAVRELRPDVVHTRNISPLEFNVPAWFGGVNVRIHGEHGRDVHDLAGKSVKYRILRRVVDLFVKRYVTVSKDLERWLVQDIGIRADRVTQIYNGVDCEKFRPPLDGEPRPEEFPFDRDCIVVGTVGRMQVVKDQLTFAHAFVELCRLLEERRPELASRLRLVMVGGGPLHEPCREILAAGGVDGRAWLPGERNDVPEIIRHYDLFVLPSIAEGISNTILEAMASGLPVIATDVGGNPELVEETVDGLLVPPSDPAALANALSELVVDPERRRRQGHAARAKIEARFSMEAMIDSYMSVYDRSLARGAVLG